MRMKKCNHCGGKMPRTLKPRAQYCSSVCRGRAAARRSWERQKEKNRRSRENSLIRRAAEKRAEERAQESKRLQKQLEREATTAQGVRKLRFVAERYERMMDNSRYLGAEYSIY